MASTLPPKNGYSTPPRGVKHEFLKYQSLETKDRCHVSVRIFRGEYEAVRTRISGDVRCSNQLPSVGWGGRGVNIF